jgi:hypothetical protein
MSTGKIGLRYERLLLLAAPLSVATLIVLFIAIASNSQNDRVLARCYSSAVELLQEKKDHLNSEWEKAGPIKGQYWGGNYKLAIQTAFIYGLHAGSDCYATMDGQIEKRYRAAPEEIIKNLDGEIESLLSTPLNYYGIEMPERAKINIFGTDIKVGLMTMTQLLQIALAPLLLLWLGSLYNTRYRETLLISRAEQLSDIFPHVINVYPCGKFRELRKPNIFLRYRRGFIAFLFLLIRSSLLIVFLAPPVTAYVASLFLLQADRYIELSSALGISMVIFSLSNLLLEMYPWHYWKVFPNQYLSIS